MLPIPSPHLVASLAAEARIVMVEWDSYLHRCSTAIGGAELLEKIDMISEKIRETEESLKKILQHLEEAKAERTVTNEPILDTVPGPSPQGNRQRQIKGGLSGASCIIQFKHYDARSLIAVAGLFNARWTIRVFVVESVTPVRSRPIAFLLIGQKHLYLSVALSLQR
jgi:hypothetical protein